MSIQEVSAERFAQLFHHYHQALADESGNAARTRTSDAWADVPPSEKKPNDCCRAACPARGGTHSQRAPGQAIFRQARRSRVGLLSNPVSWLAGFVYDFFTNYLSSLYGHACLIFLEPRRLIP